MGPQYTLSDNSAKVCFLAEACPISCKCFQSMDEFYIWLLKQKQDYVTIKGVLAYLR